MKKLRATILFCLFILIAAAAFRVGVMFPRDVDVVPLSAPTIDGAALDALLRQIASQHRYGTRDEWMEQSMWFDMAQRGQVFEVSCTYISLYAKEVIDAYGFRSRLVMTMTTDAYDGGNDGHTLLEVWHPFYDQWVVVDFSFDRMYVQPITEFVRGRSTPVILGRDTDIDPESALYYPRLAHVALIEDNGTLWFDDAANKAHIESYSPAYHYTESLARFYQ